VLEFLHLAKFADYTLNPQAVRSNVFYQLTIANKLYCLSTFPLIRLINHFCKIIQNKWQITLSIKHGDEQIDKTSWKNCFRSIFQLEGV